MQAAGLPRTELDVIDYSKLVVTGLTGLVGVVINAAWGEFDTPQLCGSWPEFVRTYGGLLDADDGALLCKRTFDGGGALKVSRVAHRDVQTIDTPTGTKAVGTLTVGAIVQAAAQATLDFAQLTAVVNGADYFAQVDGVHIGAAFNAGGSTTKAQVAAGVRAAINTATGSNGGYTATVSGTIVTVSSPAASGATYNGKLLEADDSIGNPMGMDTDTFEGGVTAIPAKGATITAAFIGALGNLCTFTTTPAVSGTAGKVDITVTFLGYPDLTTSAKEVSETAAGADLAALNAQLVNVVVSAIDSDGMGVGTVTLSTGTDPVIVAADYVGDETIGSGLRSFDTEKDIWKIACPGIASPTVDAAIEAYVEMRKDLMGVIRMPVGTSKADWLGYRNGSGSYSHQPIDNWRMCAFGGGVEIKHPVTGLRYDTSEIGDVFAAMALRSNTTQEWYSFAGQKRGRIRNVLGIVKDYASPAFRAAAGQLYENQINLAIDHERFGPVVWGNRTMQKAVITKLSKLNVAELVIFCQRNLPAIAETEAFDPNDIATWKRIYLATKQFMDYIADNGGVAGGEGEGWVYDGDQKIDKLSQAQVNSSSNIDAGMYKYKVGIAPIVALEYIWIELAVTNTGAIAEVLVNA